MTDTSQSDSTKKPATPSGEVCSLPIAGSRNNVLPFTKEVEAATAEIYEKIKDIIPAIEWPVYAPLIEKINRLKKEKNAVILAHNYQTPEIFHGVADLTGDSLALAKMATTVEEETIILCGVHFMAETAKIINPEKRVLIPDLKAGCSLADSITAADIRLLKEKYPGVPVVTYVNTSAEVKAETDICCTSSNAVAVVNSLESDQVIFLPDEYLGRWVAQQTDKQLILWKGHCEVHERFTADDLIQAREQFPGVVILAHPECPPDVLNEADFVGSTSGMINYAGEQAGHKVMMITECSMSDNVAVAHPETEFIRPCNLCPHMKRITLEKILASLENDTFEVTVPEEIQRRAKRSVERMHEIGDPGTMTPIETSGSRSILEEKAS